MIHYMTLFFLAGGPYFEVSMDDLGFYEPGLQLYQYQNHFLFVSSLDHGLALVDAKGRVIHKYEKDGLGPKELHYPYVLGISEDILIVSDLKNVIMFDNELKPTTGHYPCLPPSVASGSSILHGYVLSKSQYCLIHKAWSSRSKGITNLSFETGYWLETDTFFPQKHPPNSSLMEKLRNYNFNIHNGTLFKTTAVADDWYEVSLYQIPRKIGDDHERKMIQHLSGSLAEFPNLKPGYKAYICESFEQDFGYVVTFNISFLPQNAKYMADLFDRKGKFLKRVALNARALPCVNCEDVLIETENQNGDVVLKKLVFSFD